MSFRRTIVTVILSVVLVLAGFARAQDRQVEPDVLFGDNIGFRPNAEQHSRGRITGMLVVRVNGEWVEATFSPRLTPAAP